MANRRMLSKKIIETDAFMDMPLSSQALYMHLVINADDEGFVGGVNRIMRSIGCSTDDKRILEAKRFILGFESGVIVIKHWYIHNLIRSDRVTKTTYLDEKAQLSKKENKAYTYKEETNVIPVVIPKDNHLSPQYSREEDSIVEDSKVVHFVEKVKPPYKEIIDYLNLKVKGSYRHTTKKTRESINARWKEGFRLDDFYKAIDNTYAFRMMQDGDLTYVRPITIFNGDMENRVNGSTFGFIQQKPKEESMDDFLPPITKKG